MKKDRSTDRIGLRLSRQALWVLKERGIFAQSSVSLQHQQAANRYVVRGVESGGAAGDIGRYVTFAQEDGRPIECLHPVEAIGVNGVHSVVVAPVFVRLDMLRKARTYELLITRHAAAQADNGRRPPLETTVLFRGVHGRLELDLSGRHRAQSVGILPTFYSLSGEEIAIPEQFRPAVCASVKAANCSGCSHCHYVRARRKKEKEERVAAGDAANPARPGVVTLAEHTGSGEARTSAKLSGETTGAAEAV